MNNGCINSADGSPNWRNLPYEERMKVIARFALFHFKRAQ